MLPGYQGVENRIHATLLIQSELTVKNKTKQTQFVISLVEWEGAVSCEKLSETKKKVIERAKFQ